MGVVPAMLSERLGVPGATFAGEIEVVDGRLRIRREGDTASITAEGRLPLVASVTDQSGEPRYPSFKGIMAAKKKPVETWSLADLGIAADEVGLAASYTVVEAVEARPPRTSGEIVADDDGSGAKALVDFLASRKFI
jgi:electron transfer flavoprotein beta subunit